MTTTRALPSLPPLPGSKYNLPSPTKKDPELKPNPHPYAIKTSSSALLSRSGSSGHNISATKNFYVPSSPNASRSPEHGRGHRMSKSLNSESPTRSSPRPLPTPPPLASPTRSTKSGAGGYISGEDNDAAFRRSRAETLPATLNYELPGNTSKGDDGPPNPKLWTPSQLSSYLLKVLRTNSRAGELGEKTLLESSAHEVSAFVTDAKISGRMFLRLSESDLEGMGASKEVREALLIASRAMRQSILKGRIWGTEQSLPPSPISPSRPLPTPPFSNSRYASSSSSVDGFTSSPDKDDPSKQRRYRNGRVRGMVQSFERSGSFSSESSFDGDAAEDRSRLAVWLREEGPVDDQPLRSPSPDARFVQAPEVTEESSFQQEEPSIESLLAATESVNSENTGSWGARAWEDMLPGETVKKIVDPAASLRNSDAKAKDLHTIVGPSKGSGSRGRTREERRIVTAIFSPVQAEAEPEANTEAIPEAVPGAISEADAAPEATSAEPAREQTYASLGIATDFEKEELSHIVLEDPGEKLKLIEEREHQLEIELAETRSLLEAFRERLETVEKKVASLEEKDAERDRELQRVEDLSVDSIMTPGARASESGLPHRRSPVLPTILRQFNMVRGVSSVLGRPQSSVPDGKDDDGPSTVSELPSYVLLVGVGVCAIVLQVVLRRLVGRSAASGWKP